MYLGKWQGPAPLSTMPSSSWWLFRFARWTVCRREDRRASYNAGLSHEGSPGMQVGLSFKGRPGVHRTVCRRDARRASRHAGLSLEGRPGVTHT